jgi:two-component system, NarL family, sensor kinase
MSRTNSSNASVVRFGLAGLASVLAIGALTLFAVNRVSSAQARTEAIDRTRLVAFGIIEPILGEGSFTPGTAMFQTLDNIVQTRVLAEERVLRVKIWSTTGEILYSDEPKLIGRKFAAKLDHQRVLKTGGFEAEEASTTAPENIFERNTGQSLEVYMALRLSNGQQVIYEQYERYEPIAGNARTLLTKFGLPFGVGLGMLWLLQLPLARSLVRRVRQAEEERTVLLERAVTASGRERERIAADLHDGVVQDLAGMSFELAAAVPAAKDPATREALARSADLSRNAMVRLRSSLVDLHPLSVDNLGLSAAFDELAQPLRSNDVRVDIHIDDTLEGFDGNAIPSETSALLYRVGQESLRNIMKHAKAKRVVIDISGSKNAVELTVRDDGAGFNSSGAGHARSNGHLGLELQQTLVRRAGGRTEVSSVVGQGTTVHLELPIRKPKPHHLLGARS